MPRAMSERLMRASPEVADRFPRRSDFLISTRAVVVHEWKRHGRGERRVRQHAPRLEVDPEFTLALSCSKSRAACRGGRDLGARSWSLLRTRPDASVRLSSRSTFATGPGPRPSRRGHACERRGHATRESRAWRHVARRAESRIYHALAARSPRTRPNWPTPCDDPQTRSKLISDRDRTRGGRSGPRRLIAIGGRLAKVVSPPLPCRSWESARASRDAALGLERPGRPARQQLRSRSAGHRKGRCIVESHPWKAACRRSPAERRACNAVRRCGPPNAGRGGQIAKPTRRSDSISRGAVETTLFPVAEAGRAVSQR